MAQITLPRNSEKKKIAKTTICIYNFYSNIALSNLKLRRKYWQLKKKSKHLIIVYDTEQKKIQKKKTLQ